MRVSIQTNPDENNCHPVPAIVSQIAGFRFHLAQTKTTIGPIHVLDFQIHRIAQIPTNLNQRTQPESKKTS
jgi:hypothetical protein